MYALILNACNVKRETTKIKMGVFFVSVFYGSDTLSQVGQSIQTVCTITFVKKSYLEDFFKALISK